MPANDFDNIRNLSGITNVWQERKICQLYSSPMNKNPFPSLCHKKEQHKDYDVRQQIMPTKTDMMAYKRRILPVGMPIMPCNS